MLALGNINTVVLVGGVFLTFNIAAVVTLIRSLSGKPASLTVWIWAVTSFLFGLGISVLFFTDGTNFSEDWPDWLLAIVPLVCGGVTCLRMLFLRHEKAA